MKVYLSVDMERIAGVTYPDPTDRKHDRYPADRYRGFLAGNRLAGAID